MDSFNFIKNFNALYKWSVEFFPKEEINALETFINGAICLFLLQKGQRENESDKSPKNLQGILSKSRYNPFYIIIDEYLSSSNNVKIIEQTSEQYSIEKTVNILQCDKCNKNVNKIIIKINSNNDPIDCTCFKQICYPCFSSKYQSPFLESNQRSFFNTVKLNPYPSSDNCQFTINSKYTCRKCHLLIDFENIQTVIIKPPSVDRFLDLELDKLRFENINIDNDYIESENEIKVEQNNNNIITTSNDSLLLPLPPLTTQKIEVTDPYMRGFINQLVDTLNSYTDHLTHFADSHKKIAIENSIKSDPETEDDADENNPKKKRKLSEVTSGNYKKMLYKPDDYELRTLSDGSRRYMKKGRKPAKCKICGLEGHYAKYHNKGYR